MKDNQSGAYFVSRRTLRDTPRRKRRGSHRAAGVLIAVLLLLTAGICLLVVFLPERSESTGVSAGFGGKTYYFLATAETDEKVQALTSAQYAAERGGAGYIYNNGKYRIVASAYEREADVKTLVEVNADSHYFSLTFANSSYAKGDKRVLECLTGEWFSTVFTAASELDRGNITEAAAEHAVKKASGKLRKLAYSAESDRLKTAVVSVSLECPASRSVLSFIRYVNVGMLISVYDALN